MIRLDRITMQGFKSFANRITIPFPSGFNVVCGPNGSGKSNIVDAIMFVLGTSSARSIRAAKLRNLIFNGGKDRKPADSCEVSLYIRNDGGRLGEEDEIKITRKISRSGISIYKLNGKTVTRTKILDMLANTNLSSEGYNIIIQGDVTRIIEMSPLERKGVIDEISGIAEFDEKKEKAQRELERVEIRVRENMIVVAEKQRYVSRLRAEKEIANRYIEMSNELKRHKASLHNMKMKDIENKLHVIEKEIAQESEILIQKEKEFLKVEKVLNEKEKGMQQLSEQIISKARYEIIRKVDSLHADIARRKDRIEMNERELLSRANPAVRAVLALGYPGVHGTLQSLTEVPKKYATAIDVAMGAHRNDIVVESEDTAIKCIKHLKEKKIGRARFLPLDRIRTRKRKKCSEKIIGYAIDLVKFDRKFLPAMEHIFASTVVVENIDEAKKIKGFRVVTLDGDVIEKSGSITGGYYYRKEYEKNLVAENAQLLDEIKKMEKELDKLKGIETKESADVEKLQALRASEEKLLGEARKRWKELFEERQILQNGIGRKNIEKARSEANLENLKLEAEDFKDVAEGDLIKNLSQEELQEKVRSYLIEINRLGPVNMRAIEEYGIIHVEFEELRKKLDKLLEEKEAITRIVQEVEKKRYDKFMSTLNEVARNFSKIYKDLTNGNGNVRLEEENNIDSGLIIEASPEGKRVLNLDVMSGGEKTLTSLAFLFAVMQLYMVPFYMLDEVDAALDKANTKKIVDLIKKYSRDMQFIVITHNDFTIQEADKVFGVSMENGVSRIFGIEMPAE